MMAYSMKITNVTVTSALQCCFHTLFGSCRPTAGGRVTLKPHVPSWDLYSAIKAHRKEKKCIYGASSGKLAVRNHRYFTRFYNKVSVTLSGN